MPKGKEIERRQRNVLLPTWDTWRPLGPGWLTLRPAASSVCALSRSCLASLCNQSPFGPLTLLVTTGPATAAAQGQGHRTGLLWGRCCFCRTHLGKWAGPSMRHKGEETKMWTCLTGNSSTPLYLPAASGHCLPWSFILQEQPCSPPVLAPAA